MTEDAQRSGTSDGDAIGYRLVHLKIGLILRDLYFVKSDPRTGDAMSGHLRRTDQCDW